MTRFVDFYNSHSIIPVHQDLVEFEEFCRNRSNLYQDLGIPLGLLKEKKIIEFGPGGGYNSRLLLTKNPASFTYIDASNLSLKIIPKIIKTYLNENTQIELVDSLFLDYTSSDKFDLVIAEACIPGQDHPSETLKHISSFVADEGLLSITTTTRSSHFAEMLRSLIALRIKKENTDFEWVVNECIKLFQSHLETLPGKTRTIRDWVLDNVIQEIHQGKYEFNFSEALNTLEEFVFVGSSPRFYQNYKWYKTNFTFNERNIDAENQFKNMEILLFDYRITQEEFLHLDIEKEKVLSILSKIDLIYDIVTEILKLKDLERIDYVFELLEDLYLALPVSLVPTRNSLQDFIENKSFFTEDYLPPDFNYFKNWFGRGQQFFSFQRTAKQ